MSITDLVRERRHILRTVLMPEERCSLSTSFPKVLETLSKPNADTELDDGGMAGMIARRRCMEELLKQKGAFGGKISLTLFFFPFGPAS